MRILIILSFWKSSRRHFSTDRDAA